MSMAVYVRVSTAGQNEAGQRREIERWLKGNRIKNAVWYVDRETGDNLDRPEFKRLQEAVFMGEHDAVVVYKLDRLSRTIRDGLAVLCQLVRTDPYNESEIMSAGSFPSLPPECYDLLAFLAKSEGPIEFDNIPKPLLATRLPYAGITVTWSG